MGTQQMGAPVHVRAKLCKAAAEQPPMAGHTARLHTTTIAEASLCASTHPHPPQPQLTGL